MENIEKSLDEKQINLVGYESRLDDQINFKDTKQVLLKEIESNQLH